MTVTTQWEYRVQTFGSTWKAAKADEIEETLQEWGEEGWEVVCASHVESSYHVMVIAKRPLTLRSRRERSLP